VPRDVIVAQLVTVVFNATVFDRYYLLVKGNREMPMEMREARLSGRRPPQVMIGLQ
jgi:hypothetical protein